MPLTTIHEAPAIDSFTSLADHQSQTPTTFYGAKPVLHYHAAGSRAIGSRDQIRSLPVFQSSTAGAGTGPGVESNGEPEQVVETVDVFITSEKVVLFNTSASIGVSIPYPAISLHAIQTITDPANLEQQVRGLYMQLELSEPRSEEDEDMEGVELTILPVTPATDAPNSGIQALFEAVSNCSNLNPDPTFQDDEDMEDGDIDSRIVFEGSVGYEGISGLPGVQPGATDGGLPAPFPGSGGWITAENVSEYFDEEGNWIRGGESEVLGEGAGRVRMRDEIDSVTVNGHERAEADDSKRARTD